MGEEVIDIQRVLGRLEAKVDHLIAAQSVHAEQHEETERRVSAVESDLKVSKAVGGLLGFLATIAATVLPGVWHR